MPSYEDRDAEKALKKQRQAARLKGERIDAAVGALLQHRDGREFLWWLLEIGRYGQNTFATNALNMSFACGEANVGLRVWAKICEVNPDGFLAMMKEQQDERHPQRDSDEPDAE